MGIFGDYPKKSPKFGDGDTGLISFGDASGTGRAKTLGIFGENSPKISDFRGGDGGKILGDFPLTSHVNGKYEKFFFFFSF